MLRSGDRLLLIVIAASLVLLVADGATDGALAAGLRTHLPGAGQWAGRWLAWFGLVLSPLLLVPLATALAGRFVRLPEPVWTAHRRVIGALDTISETVGGAARWFALGLVVVTAIVVIQRYVFGFASTKLQESVIYMHALLFLLASASTLLAGGHVRVDVFYAKAGLRGKAWTDLLGTYLALIPMCALILWSSTSYVWSAWRILESSRERDGLAFVFLLKTAIPAFAVLMILQGVAMAARAAMTIAGQTPPGTPDAVEAEI